MQWEKNKKQRVGQRGGLDFCPFVISFLCLWSPVKMVYFLLLQSVRLSMHGRLLGLLITFYVLAMVGHLKNVSPTFAQMPDRITNVEFTTVSPTIANTMLAAVFFHSYLFFFRNSFLISATLPEKRLSYQI